MIQQFKKTIQKLQDVPYVDRTIIETFLKHASKHNLTREENPLEHFCSFFIPVDKKKKIVFLGHHIIADDWIPPGGHIEKGELPNQTVLREFKEELNFTINEKNIELFNISTVPVRKTTRPCKVHYDFWYVVSIPQTPFAFDTKEFYDARWFSLSEALKIMKRDEYKEIIKTIFKEIE